MNILRQGILFGVMLAAGGFAAPLHAQDAAKTLSGPGTVSAEFTPAEPFKFFTA